MRHARALVVMLSMHLCSCALIFGIEQRDQTTTDAGSDAIPPGGCDTCPVDDLHVCHKGVCRDFTAPDNWRMGDTPYCEKQTSGVLLDKATGLEWDPDTTFVPYADGKATCAAVRTGGHSDWRVPTRIELTSVWNYKEANLSKDCFPTQPTLKKAEFFCSSSPNNWDPGRHFMLISSNGEWAAPRVGSGGFECWVHCVRRNLDDAEHAPPPGPRFVLTAEGDILDKNTKLVWQGTVSDPTKSGAFWSHVEANAKCSALAGGWSIPTFKQLYTLIDESSTGPPLVDKIFAATTPPDRFLWTNTQTFAVGVFDSVITTNFTDGYATTTNTTMARGTYRCVKPAP